MSKTVYDFPVVDIHGNQFDFSTCRGKKILLVNTASACGLTPQYRQLEELQQRRTTLLAELGRVDEEIAKMQGARQTLSSSASVRPQKLVNAKSLREYVLEILGRSKRGMSLSDLSAKVLAAGYRTESSNFRNVLYQCLYNTKDVYHDDGTGTYRLKSLQAEPTR